MIFPFKRSLAQAVAIPKGVSIHTTDALYQGVLPDTLICALVDDVALSGSVTKNPFNFEHAKISELTLLHGHKTYPLLGYRPDFVNGDYQRDFLSVLHELGRDEETQNMLDINAEEWAKGFTFFVFQITKGPADVLGPRSNSEAGEIRARFNFAAATDKHYKLIVIGEFLNKIEIDKFNNVVLT